MSNYFDYGVELDRPSPDTPCECGECTWTGPFSQLDGIDSCCLTPGDPSPAGRCPVESCGSLAYVKQEDLRVMMSEIAELLDGLGPDITPHTIDVDYLARARYLAEIGAGKRERFPDEA